MWQQVPAEAAAGGALAGAHGGDSLPVPQVPAEVQVPGQQEQPQVRRRHELLTVAMEMEIILDICAMRMLLLPLLLLHFNKLLFIVNSQLLCNLTICVLSTALPLLPCLCLRPAQTPADPLGRPQQGEPQGVGGEHSHPPALALAQLLAGERG